MTTFEIRPETETDIPALNALSAAAFGPGRFARSAYRVREGIAPVANLSLTAWEGAQIAGGVRFTAIRVGDRDGGSHVRVWVLWGSWGTAGVGGSRQRPKGLVSHLGPGPRTLYLEPAMRYHLPAIPDSVRFELIALRGPRGDSAPRCERVVVVQPYHLSTR